MSVPSPSQGKYLIAHIDADNNICEFNESNNLANRQILWEVPAYFFIPSDSFYPAV